jgi:hypothetical protein
VLASLTALKRLCDFGPRNVHAGGRDVADQRLALKKRRNLDDHLASKRTRENGHCERFGGSRAWPSSPLSIGTRDFQSRSKAGLITTFPPPAQGGRATVLGLCRAPTRTAQTGSGAQGGIPAGTPRHELDDYGGGTPVVDVWRRDTGIGVRHAEPAPKLVSLPVAIEAPTTTLPLRRAPQPASLGRVVPHLPDIRGRPPSDAARFCEHRQAMANQGLFDAAPEAASSLSGVPGATVGTFSRGSCSMHSRW